MASDSGYLLDTNIVVHLIRKNAIGQEINAKYELSSSLHLNAVSVVTVGEMHSLARQLGWGEEKRDPLEELLDEIVWIDINNLELIRAYGEIDAASQKDGRKMGKNDIWIAATAHVTGMTLLTTDKDFDYAHPRFLKRIWIDPDLKSGSD